MKTKKFSNNIDNKLEKYYNKCSTNSKRYFRYVHNDFSNKHYFIITENTKMRKLYLLHNINKSHLINNEHDKIFRTALSNKKDACKFIKSIIDFKVEINENDLELYRTNFVTSEFNLAN